MLLSEYIAMLQKFAAGKDDLPVQMTQKGYYAEGDLADLYDEPEREGNAYTLGHSYQSY